MTTPQPPYGQSGQPPGYYPTGPPAYYPAPPPAYAPPPKKRRWIWGLVAALVGVVILIIVGLVFLFSSLFHSIGPARDATNGYFAAVKAHDWVAAQGYLSASLRATVEPADLQATWLRREQADGPVDQFRIMNTNVNTTNGKTTATVTGTLYYGSGATDPKIVTLVKEDGDWKLSRLP